MGEYPKTYRVFVKEGLGTLRAEMIDGKKWFYGVDVCKILGLPKMCRLVSTGIFKKEECILVERLAKNGRRKIYLISLKGIIVLLNTKGALKDKDKLVAFSNWFNDEVSPALCTPKKKKEVIASTSEQAKEKKEVQPAQIEKEEKVTATIPDQTKEVKDMRATENAPAVGEQVFANGNFRIFGNAEFGNIRTELINGEPWFVGKDVATALGYGEGKSIPNAIANHVDEIDKGVTEMMTPGGKQNAIIINESGLYALIFGSKLPSAKRFKRWVTSEVLPAIRQTGSYQQTPPKPLTQLEMMRLQLGMIDNHEDRIKNLEDTMTIDYGQQEPLANTVNRSVIDALGGKQSNAYKEIAKKVFAECNHDLKTYFNVNARNNVPRKRYDEAIEYAKNWKPCTNTLMLIRGCNAQMSF